MQLGKECDRRLFATWTAEPAPGGWRLRYLNGTDPSGFIERFESLAQKAAARLGSHAVEFAAVSFWLDRIKRNWPKSHKKCFTDADGQLYSQDLEDVCYWSAYYCDRCEADEIRQPVPPSDKGVSDQPRRDGQSVPNGLQSSDRNNPATTPNANQYILTEDQQNRIGAAEKAFKDAVDAHEQMREMADPGEWQRPGLYSNESPSADWVAEIRKLEGDIKGYAITTLTILAEASWPVGSLATFSDCLKSHARDILTRALAKVNPKDLYILNQRSIKAAVNQEISDWIRKAQREFRPIWDTRAPTPIHSSTPPAIQPGEPLSENVPPDDPKHKILAPFFEVKEKFQVLADEYPELSIDWWAESGKWLPWPPPARAVKEGEECLNSPGSDLHIKMSAGDAGARLLESPESWFNPGRDPWLDVKDKEPWERWLYAIREFWLKARDEADDETEDGSTDASELA